MDITFMLYIWIGVVCAAALIEALTMQLVSVWFIPGGLVSLILFFCGVGYEIQIIVFFAVSLIMMIALRKFCIKWLRKGKQEATNADALLNQQTKLLKAITSEQNGEVKFNGIIWTAVADTEIAEGEIVCIKEIQGNKLVVSKVEKTETN
ncbi:MAG: NfeD family protein [Clostridia bacterium]|nr:NfeD family protein [Clostridia bacterium]